MSSFPWCPELFDSTLWYTWNFSFSVFFSWVMSCFIRFPHSTSGLFFHSTRLFVSVLKTQFSPWKKFLLEACWTHSFLMSVFFAPTEPASGWSFYMSPGTLLIHFGRDWKFCYTKVLSLLNCLCSKMSPPLPNLNSFLERKCFWGSLLQQTATNKKPCQDWQWSF